MEYALTHVLTRQERSGNLSREKTTMAGDSSIASELIQAINLPNLKPIPSYLSEADAMTVHEYLQTEYAREYNIDTSNVYWGGEPNSNHVYDMFSEFRSHHDSVKTRLEMLKFVIDNERRYDWNGHLFLRMNNLTLTTWLQHQNHFSNSADGLAIYALSDMCGVHATIVTKTKPWTTIHPTYNGNVYDALRICKVNMVYLGYNKFARLRKKANPEDPSYITQSYNLLSMVVFPAPPTREELETAKHYCNFKALRMSVTRTQSLLMSVYHRPLILLTQWIKFVGSMRPLQEIPTRSMMHFTRFCSLQKNLRMSYMWKRIQRFVLRWTWWATWWYGQDYQY